MDLTITALKNLYVALGGNEEDVENLVVTPDVINAIAGLEIGGGDTPKYQHNITYGSSVNGAIISFSFVNETKTAYTGTSAVFTALKDVMEEGEVIPVSGGVYSGSIAETSVLIPTGLKRATTTRFDIIGGALAYDSSTGKFTGITYKDNIQQGIEGSSYAVKDIVFEL